MKITRKKSHSSGWGCLFVIIVSVCMLIVVFAIPYGKAAFYTYRYGDAFKNRNLDSSMVDAEISSFHVLEYDGETAKVYYVAENHESAYILSFARAGNDWIMESWDIAWTIHGNGGHPFVWPYYG